jgi:hypothetical protein
MTDVFTRILRIDLPETLPADESGKNPAFTITFVADGEIPFPQVILHAPDGQHLLNGAAIQAGPASGGEHPYTASVPAGLLWPNPINVQVEGCRKADIRQSGGGDWIKEFRPMRIAPNAKVKPTVRIATGPGDAPVKLYFGIHKHMHQPYYNTTDRLYWDGERMASSARAVGNYTHFIPPPRASTSTAACPTPACRPPGAAR